MKIVDKYINLILVLLFCVGLSLLLYPSVSDYINSLHSSKAIIAYTESLAELSREECERLLQEALAYNRSLAARENPFILDADQADAYWQLLNTAGDGMMGYIEIPSVDIELPIYHGTSDSVLKTAVGHLDWSSLPVGGPGSHCVLSSHRGLPSAKLFTDLDKLREGDVFLFRVLDQVLTYEVDQILIVEPMDIGSLFAEEGRDYCTLVTCTPYGINTHRLLIRGHRIENTDLAASTRVTSDAAQVEPLVVAAVIGIPVLLFLMVVTLRPRGGHRSRDDAPAMTEDHHCV